jgi:structure-specific endonuclease subunit SLX1
MSDYFCYILRNTNPLYNNLTYNGITNNLSRRLRQHNGEITGGAKYTKNKGPWEYYVIIQGFTNKCEALSCEWRIKYPTNKKRPRCFCGQIGRIKSLNLILNLEKWTNKTKIINSDNNYVIYISDDMSIYLDKEFKNNIIIKSITSLI